jgi:DNA primase large subunit
MHIAHLSMIYQLRQFLTIKRIDRKGSSRFSGRSSLTLFWVNAGCRIGIDEVLAFHSAVFERADGEKVHLMQHPIQLLKT